MRDLDAWKQSVESTPLQGGRVGKVMVPRRLGFPEDNVQRDDSPKLELRLPTILSAAGSERNPMEDGSANVTTEKAPLASSADRPADPCPYAGKSMNLYKLVEATEVVIEMGDVLMCPPLAVPTVTAAETERAPTPVKPRVAPWASLNVLEVPPLPCDHCSTCCRCCKCKILLKPESCCMEGRVLDRCMYHLASNDVDPACNLDDLESMMETPTMTGLAALCRSLGLNIREMSGNGMFDRCIRVAQVAVKLAHVVGDAYREMDKREACAEEERTTAECRLEEMTQLHAEACVELTTVKGRLDMSEAFCDAKTHAASVMEAKLCVTETELKAAVRGRQDALDQVAQLEDSLAAANQRAQDCLDRAVRAEFGVVNLQRRLEEETVAFKEAVRFHETSASALTAEVSKARERQAKAERQTSHFKRWAASAVKEVENRLLEAQNREKGMALSFAVKESQWTKDIDQSLDKVDVLQEEVKSLKTKLAEVTERAVQAESEVVSFSSSMVTMLSEARKARAEERMTVAELKSEIRDAEAEAAAFSRACEEGKQQLAAVVIERDQLLQQVRDAQTRQADNAKKVVDMEAKLAALDGVCKHLQALNMGTKSEYSKRVVAADNSRLNAQFELRETQKHLKLLGQSFEQQGKHRFFLTLACAALRSRCVKIAQEARGAVEPSMGVPNDVTARTAVQAGEAAVEAVDTAVQAGEAAVEAVDTAVQAGEAAVEAVDTAVQAAEEAVKGALTVVEGGVAAIETSEAAAEGCSSPVISDNDDSVVVQNPDTADAPGSVSNSAGVGAAPGGSWSGLGWIKFW